jgi:hypothetical protein
MDGGALPHSHALTVLTDTLHLRASDSCVQPFSFRAAAILSPIGSFLTLRFFAMMALSASKNVRVCP